MRHRGKKKIAGLGCILFAAIVAIPSCSRAQSPTPDTASPKSAPTPRTPDGKPDLSGYWGGAGPGLAQLGGPPKDPKDLTLTAPLRNGDISNLTNDNTIMHRQGENLPLYKPQYWDIVLDRDWNGNLQDPVNSCMPPGEPRMGPPTRIVQTPNEVFLFYSVIFQRNDYRDIPIGPRTHPVNPDGTWGGDPIAHWEGDTLVVVTEGFNDQTWLGSEGYIHSYNLKVTEKFHRDGDMLTYDVTIEDPDMLQKPWVLETRHVKLNTNPSFRMEESPPCSDRDAAHIKDKNRE